MSWIFSQIVEQYAARQVCGFLGDAEGTAISAALVQGLNEAAVVADALDDTSSALSYRKTAANFSKATNELLWNNDLGVYVRSASSNTSFRVADIAFAISSGVASEEHAKSSLAKLAA